MKVLLSSIILFLFLFEDASSAQCGAKERKDHPMLCRMLDHAENDLDGLAAELHNWARSHGLLVELPGYVASPDTQIQVTDDYVAASSRRRRLNSVDQQLPVVLTHGMGDSCFNEGMVDLTARVSEALGGVYAVCIPTGKSQSEDTSNGYLLNMDASVDVFAEAIRKDPQLQRGFHGIGLSQGNNVLRGYIAKMNAPAVHSFLAINGLNAGTAAVPYCIPKDDGDNDGLAGSFSMCEFLMEQASNRAYTDFAQEHSFQANYWRDPRPSMKKRYQEYSQLAVWNNEAGFVNQTLKENFAKTQKFVWVLATEDGMVWPKEGEQWCAPDPNDPFKHILPMNETEWYKDDLFGLRTADEAGKNYFESFKGDHLRFEFKVFARWVKTYLAQD